MLLFLQQVALSRSLCLATHPNLRACNNSAMTAEASDVLPDAFRVDEPGSTDCMRDYDASPTPKVALPTCRVYEELLALADEADNQKVEDRLRAAAALAFIEHRRSIVEVAAMRDVLDNELTDREANAARVVERQNVLADRASATATDVGMATAAFERAAMATAAIEDAIASLEVAVLVPSPECARLAAEQPRQ